MRKNISLSDNFYNTRELGGHSDTNGKMTKFGVYIRTNIPNTVEEKDVIKLNEVGIVNVFDLRKKEEIDSKPHPLNIDGFNYINVSLNETCWGDDYHNLSINDRYITILEQNKLQIGKIVDTISSLSGATLFGCSAGKDRTGILAYILLSIADVSINEIVDDYTLSKINYINYSKQKGILIDESDLSEPCRIEALNKYIKEKYSSITEFLYTCEVSEKSINLIKEKLQSF